MTYPNLLELAHRHHIVLGSGSPRRFALLTEAGIEFSVLVPKVEEVRRNGEAPFPYAVRLAEEKAVAASRATALDTIALGFDTIVVLENQTLEKPADPDHAATMLTLLSGRKHTVCTACALARRGTVLASGYELTDVVFNSLSPEQIQSYIASGEPMDKAGAYGIQGMGGFLVDRISGNLDTVVGLPRTLLEHLAGEILRRE